MAISNFLSEVWSSSIQTTLENAQVYASLTNRDHEGEIRSAGDTVRINAVGPITVSSFTRNTDINAPEELTSTQAVLLIDQQDYFNFQVDDLDAAQANAAVMAKAVHNAAYAMADATDISVVTEMVASGTSLTTGIDATPTVSSGNTSFYENLVVAGVALTEAKVSKDGRFAVIPPWLTGQLLLDNRFINANASGSSDPLINGKVGRAAGFDLYESNNAPATGADFKVVLGTRDATTYAEQVTKVEGFRPERRFADAVKGVNLYGHKVILPAALQVITQTRP